jgi:multiple sugar transport system substrate-binding protein
MKKTVSTPISRRLVLGAAVTAAGLALSGCGGGGSAPAAGGGNVELNFVYWGDATRAKMTDRTPTSWLHASPGAILRTC